MIDDGEGAMMGHAMQGVGQTAGRGAPRRATGALVLAAVLMAGGLAPIRAGAEPAPAIATVQGLSYADLVDLTAASQLVLRAVVRRQAVLEAARAPGVRPGFARIYVEAVPTGVLIGHLPPVEAIHYLADVPVTPGGKVPNLKKQEVLLFAHGPNGDAAAAPPGAPPAKAIDVQLVAPDAQLAWDAGVETRVAAIFTALTAADAPPPVTGVHEAIYVAGNLAGEGETQIFLTLANGHPASISVEHAAGQPVTWSASFSEVVNAGGHPPAHDTLEWYRLACGLPRALPAGVNVSESASDKAQAAADYDQVLTDLGPCVRNRM